MVILLPTVKPTSSFLWSRSRILSSLSLFSPVSLSLATLSINIAWNRRLYLGLNAANTKSPFEWKDTQGLGWKPVITEMIVWAHAWTGIHGSSHFLRLHLLIFSKLKCCEKRRGGRPLKSQCDLFCYFTVAMKISTLKNNVKSLKKKRIASCCDKASVSCQTSVLQRQPVRTL